jgi:hypothetical protein
MTNGISKGLAGEQLIAQFFDSKFSKFFCFPNPKTKSRAQVADVLVWMNRVVFLAEVKSRDEGTTSIDTWAANRIQQAIDQITSNFDRIKRNERILLHNQYYHTDLDCRGVTAVVGLIILVHSENCKVMPSSVAPGIYEQPLPIHVFSWLDLMQMTTEIDTVADLHYYLLDRFDYLKLTDIPLGSERNVLGHYKMQSNKFPPTAVDFAASDYWHEYHLQMADQILARNAHSQYSSWLDKLESAYSDQRKLFSGLPIGLYMVWEIGAISRRERAYLGEKISSVREWFEAGRSTRRFAWLNQSTGNWLVFYFSKNEPRSLERELRRLVELKLIKEVHDTNFNFGAYGFGFQVSLALPPRLVGLQASIIMGADFVEGKYSQADVDESRIYWGHKGDNREIPIQEFPSE